MKIFFAIILLVGLSSCVRVTIKAPEDLVSDTVDVGKDAYQAVKEKVSGKKADKTFVHTYPVKAGESIEAANAQCSDLVKTKARESLNVYNLAIKTLVTETKIEDGSQFIECRLTTSVK